MSTSRRSRWRSGPDLSLRDGRRGGRPRHGGMSKRARSVRRRRSAPADARLRTGWAATRCPTCSCSAAAAGRVRSQYVDAAASRPVDRPGRRRRGRRSGAAAVLVGDRGRGEPVQGAAGAAEDHGRPGRHHPQGRRDASSPSKSPAGHRAAAPGPSGVTGDSRVYNPGWHLALDLRNLLLVSLRRGQGGAGASGEPRRSHPRRLSGDGLRLAPCVAGAVVVGRGQRGPGAPLEQVPMRA